MLLAVRMSSYTDVAESNSSFFRALQTSRVHP